VPSFKLKSSWVTILQGVEFSIFVLILAWALQQCSAIALPVMQRYCAACDGSVRLQHLTANWRVIDEFSAFDPLKHRVHVLQKVQSE